MELKFANTDETLDKLTDLVCVLNKEMSHDCTKEEIKKDLSNMVDKGVVIYLEDDGVPVAMMSGFRSWYSLIRKWVAQEHWFFVHPDHRGEKLSKALVAAFMSWGKSLDCSSVILTPSKHGPLDIERMKGVLEDHNFEVYGYQMMRDLK